MLLSSIDVYSANYTGATGGARVQQQYCKDVATMVPGHSRVLAGKTYLQEVIDRLRTAVTATNAAVSAATPRIRARLDPARRLRRQRQHVAQVPQQLLPLERLAEIAGDNQPV